jgi:hypothetical protein
VRDRLLAVRQRALAGVGLALPLRGVHLALGQLALARKLRGLGVGDELVHRAATLLERSGPIVKPARTLSQGRFLGSKCVAELGHCQCVDKCRRGVVEFG